MVTLNHLREGGKARAGQEIKGRVRMVMQGGLERLVDEMLDEAAEAEEARRARVEQERAAAEQERQRRAAEGLPAADGDGAGRGAKAGPDHDARLLAVVLSLANSGYLSKACARFYTNPIAETGLFHDGLTEEQELVRNTLRSLHPQRDERRLPALLSRFPSRSAASSAMRPTPPSTERLSGRSSTPSPRRAPCPWTVSATRSSSSCTTRARM